MPSVPAPAPDQRPPHDALRSPTGRGRPYLPEAVAAVRALIEGTGLPHVEIASRTGVQEGTVARWARRFGWARPATGAGVELSRAGEGEPDAPAARRARRRYGPEDVEAARVAIEGSRTSLEKIERELGISTATLARWKRSGRWRRPGHPDGRARPARYRIARGRPYAADLVEAVRVLAMGTELSHKIIAERVGVAQSTVSQIIRRRNWARPPVRPGSPRSYASKRTAPVRTGGDRRGRPYAAETVAAARELFQQTRLPAAFIAARVKVGVDTVYRWKKAGGWTRPHHLPDPQGRYPGRRRRRRRPVSSDVGGGGPCEAWWKGQRDGRDV